MNRLEKPLIFSYTPGRPGFAGYAGTPGQPARTVRNRGEVCTYYPSQETPDPNTGISSGGRRCYEVEQTTQIPARPPTSGLAAIPAIPANIIYDYRLGWNARARSALPMVTSGRFQFTIPASSTGVVCGLSFTPQDRGYADIVFGFYVSHGVVRVFEGGAEALYVGYYPGALLSITREGGKIKYAVGGTVVHTRDNESSPAFLAAALYSAGDIVENASLTNLASGYGTATMRPMQAFGGDVPYASGSAEFLPMTATGSQNRTGVGGATFEPMQAFGGNVPYASGGARFLPMTAEGDALGLAPTYAFGSAVFVAPGASGYGMTGEVGSGGATFEPLFAIGADRPYTYGGARFMPMTAYGENYLEDDEVVVFSMGFAGVELATSTELFAVMSTTMQFEGLLAVSSVLNAEMTSAVEAATTAAVQQTLLATIASLTQASTLSTGGEPARTVWALNVAVNGSTRYEGFDFNSFAKVGNSYYAAKTDGVYLLEGDADDGVDIAARINFGNNDFGDNHRKALPFIYAGIAANGQMVMKVIADGATHYYPMRHSTELLKAHRFELGKGLRASYYDLELQNVAGAAFDLSEIEFQPIQLTRRL